MKFFNGRSKFKTAICLGLILLGCCHLVFVQEQTTNKKWNFLTDIYLLFPNISGETGVGDALTVPIDANPGDIFSKLKVGGMLFLEGHTNKWAVTSDLVFMNLNEEVPPGIVFHSGDVTMKQFIWEAAGLYRLNSFVEIGLGARLNNLQTAIDGQRNVFPAGTENVSGDKSASWYDPIIITRVAKTIKDKWLLQFHGDLGGFGIGSDITWQMQAYAGYRFTKLLQLTAGYRLLSTDYKKGDEPKTFTFNVNEFGPVIRLGFNC